LHLPTPPPSSHRPKCADVSVIPLLCTKRRLRPGISAPFLTTIPATEVLTKAALKWVLRSQSWSSIMLDLPFVSTLIALMPSWMGLDLSAVRFLPLFVAQEIQTYPILLLSASHIPHLNGCLLLLPF